MKDDMVKVQSNMVHVKTEVTSLSSELDSLSRSFTNFMKISEGRHHLSLAETRIIKIRQELEIKFGHYAEIRRTTTGILQATDVGIIRSSTIKNVTEELMITTPNYWLAPCLVALSAWISDEQELSVKALEEGFRRDPEKTSLLFALICRRAQRDVPAQKWLHQYLENQDATDLDYKCIVIIDAFTAGLFGPDAGEVGNTLSNWVSDLESQSGFKERQIERWAAAFYAMRRPTPESDFPQISAFSPTWPEVASSMEVARLHKTVLGFFGNIFSNPGSKAAINKRLDEILDSLVSNFDEEELPLRVEERRNQLIIDFDGDKERADKIMEEEEKAMETHKDFMRLLTDAAMRPKTTHSSVTTQKFAIVKSKKWIIETYKELTQKNRSQVPDRIHFTVDTYSSSTKDGGDEADHRKALNKLIDSEKETELAAYKAGIAGIPLIALGLIAIGFGAVEILTNEVIMGAILSVLGGIGAVAGFLKIKGVNKKRAEIDRKHEERRVRDQAAVSAFLSEVVDYREKFASTDKGAQDVIEFMENLDEASMIMSSFKEIRAIDVKEAKSKGTSESISMGSIGEINTDGLNFSEAPAVPTREINLTEEVPEPEAPVDVGDIKTIEVDDADLGPDLDTDGGAAEIEDLSQIEDIDLGEGLDLGADIDPEDLSSIDDIDLGEETPADTDEDKKEEI